MSVRRLISTGDLHREGTACQSHACAPVGGSVVCIDPEDREQVERLRIALHGGGSGMDPWLCGTDSGIQAALRSLLAPPKLPKPDEPQGLGAVVEDSRGRRWVRIGELGYAGADDWKRAGTGLRNDWTTYAYIDAVRVLSEGVTA